MDLLSSLLSQKVSLSLATRFKDKKRMKKPVFHTETYVLLFFLNGTYWKNMKSAFLIGNINKWFTRMQTDREKRIMYLKSLRNWSIKSLPVQKKKNNTVNTWSPKSFKFVFDSHCIVLSILHCFVFYQQRPKEHLLKFLALLSGCQSLKWLIWEGKVTHPNVNLELYLRFVRHFAV